MYHTRLIQTYISLNKEEKKMLNLYIKHKYVKFHKDLWQFFLFFSEKKYLNEQIITKEKAFIYIYGENEDYNDQKIRHLIWLCTKLIEEFIIEYQIKKNTTQNYKSLVDFYLEKQLNEYALQLLNIGLKATEQTKTKDNQYYLDKYYFMSNIYDLSSIESRNKLLYVNELSEQINTYYIMEVLKNAVEVLSIKALNSEIKENDLLPILLDYIPKTNLLQNPLIDIYYKTYHLINYDEEANFDPLLKNIKKYEKLFSINDINILYKLIINYCIRKHNLNIIKYREAAFNTYLYALKKGFLFDYEHITRFIFSNVVTLGIRLNYLRKVENFIKRYAIYIEPNFKDITIAFNEAKLFYAKRNYKKAVTILLTNQFKDVLWNLNMKHLLLKIYYETNEIELLKFQLKAFKNYTSRKNNIGYHQTYFKHIAKAFSTLINYKENPKKFKKYKLDKDTPDYDWFYKMFYAK